MCGIAGIVHWEGKPVEPSEILAMTRAIAHRGPDDEGHVLIDAEGRRAPMEFRESASDAEGYHVALGNRRLSIIDLSSLGHQPMFYGGCTVVYNGEIYNYLELAEELRHLGHEFVSHCDTEVLLHAYGNGAKTASSGSNRDFWFAIWDSRNHSLSALEDVSGLSRFIIASTLGVLFLLGNKGIAWLFLPQKPGVNEPLVYDLLTTGRLDQTEETFFQGIRCLPAAHFLVLTREGLRIKRYWSVEAGPEIGASFADNARTFAIFFMMQFVCRCAPMFPWDAV